MNKIILLEIGFNVAFVETIYKALEIKLVDNTVDLLLMLFCSLLSRVLATKLTEKMKGKKIVNILGLVKDVVTTTVEIIKTVKTVKKKKNDSKK